MIHYLVCPADKTKVDQYDDEKILYCENNKMEFYRT